MKNQSAILSFFVVFVSLVSYSTMKSMQVLNKTSNSNHITSTSKDNIKSNFSGVTTRAKRPSDVCCNKQSLLNSRSTQKKDVTGTNRPSGPTGVIGAVVPMSTQCLVGPTGATGATGPQGLQGVPGPTGPSGSSVYTDTQTIVITNNECLGDKTILCEGSSENMPKVYKLCENIMAHIYISGSNIYFDLNGYALTGSIRLAGYADNVVVANGTIVSDLYGHGYGIDAPSTTNCKFINLYITGFNTGIFLYNSYPKGLSSNNTISTCICDENNDCGIVLESSHDNTIEFCTCRLNVIGLCIRYSFGNSISNCSCQSATVHARDTIGILLDTSSYNELYCCSSHAYTSIANSHSYGIRTTVLKEYIPHHDNECTTYYYQSSDNSYTHELQSNNNIIIGCHASAYASPLSSKATGIHLGGTETSVHACHVDASSHGSNSTGIEITGIKNCVQDCTIKSEIYSPIASSECIGIHINAHEQSISTCNIQVSGNAQAFLVTSSYNNIISCTITGTHGNMYGIVCTGNEYERNIIENNIIRGPFSTGILLGKNNFDAPQATLCKNNIIDNFNSMLQLPYGIGIKCHDTIPYGQPNYIENNSICNCITPYIDAGSSRQNFFVRNIMYNSSHFEEPMADSFYDNIIIPSN